VLSKQNRLSLKTNRFRIEREGKTFRSPLFTYLVASREDPSLPTRLAVLVSKKNVPQSVNRHRLRRLLTEIIRHHLDQFPPSLDVILIPKKGLQTTPPDQILSDLLHILNS